MPTVHPVFHARQGSARGTQSSFLENTHMGSCGMGHDGIPYVVCAQIMGHKVYT